MQDHRRALTRLALAAADPGRSSRPGSGGFTLIELMIVLVIAAILITVGVPSFTEFIAGQRVRAATSDIIADVAFARAEAIKESRQAIMERIPGATGTWKDGWRICVDIDRNGACATSEERKVTLPVPGRVKVCSHTANFADRVVFRPDGRLVLAAAPGANDGLTLSDDLGDSSAGNDLIRTVSFGISGRPVVLDQDAASNGGVLCP